MSHSLQEVGRTSVRIFAAIAAAVVLGLGAIAAVVLYITVEFNHSAQAATKSVIGVNFEDIRQDLARLTRSYAHWNMMYDAVTGGRRILIENDVGYLVHQRGLLDFVAVTDHDGLVRHAFMDHDRDAGAEAFPRLLAEQVSRAVRDIGPPWTESVAGFYRVGERFAAVSGSAITPSKGLGPDRAPPPIMITGRYIDPLAVPSAKDLLSDSNLVLALGDIVPQPDRNFLRLRDAQGQTVGALIWQPRTPGFDVLRSSAPIIAIACAVFALSGTFVVRASDSLRLALKNEGDVARTDPLTGLPNRSGLETFLQTEAVTTALRAGHVAVLYLDLNGFKLLNDTEGHANGDAALRITAKRLMRSRRDGDIVARVGGDEFVCVVIDRNPCLASARIMARIEANTASPVKVDGKGYLLRPAIGRAIAKPGDGWAGLVSRADADMYEAKRAAGKSRLDIRAADGDTDAPAETGRDGDAADAA